MKVDLFQGADGLWRDSAGVIYALTESKYSKDSETRLGVAPFVLPKSVPINDAAKAHDYAYSCPAYQRFYTREEADLMLKNHIKMLGKGTLWEYMATPLYLIVRLFGGSFWEEKSTNK